MATSTSGSTGWFSGRVKSVPSGDCLVIVARGKAIPPPEKTIILSYINAPRLAWKGKDDDPFAWDSREYLRDLCIGKDVRFKVEYTMPSSGREFGAVYIGEENVAKLIVSEGWAKVKEKNSKKNGDKISYSNLLVAQERAKLKGLGAWNKDLDVSKKSISRYLPPSAMGSSSKFDLNKFLNEKNWEPLHGIVEHVRDGSTLRVNILPEFQFLQVCVAGIQAPSMGRRAPSNIVAQMKPVSGKTNGDIAQPKPSSYQANGDMSKETDTSSTSSEVVGEIPPSPFGMEAKHFTELSVLNRDVWIVPKGVDKYNNLVGSVFSQDEELDLALDLVQNGLAKCVKWSLDMIQDDDARKKLKSAELQAKKSRLNVFINHVPRVVKNSKAIDDQNFTGKVVEIVSGDCIIVADDSIPYAETRVNLSSIRCKRLGNPRRNVEPEAYAWEARELLRQRLIGKQVNVSMEYCRRVNGSKDEDGPAKEIYFGSVFLVESSSIGDQQSVVNVAELLVARGYATVDNHPDSEERSKYYDALSAAEARAKAGKKGTHSEKKPPEINTADFLEDSPAKRKAFLEVLKQTKKIPAVVEHVFSGHRFKLLIPNKSCNIALSLSGVRCPGPNEPYSKEAITLVRRTIMHRDVEIEVETCDKNMNYLGSVWESNNNVAVMLLKAGLANLQTFRTEDIPEFHLLQQAEQSAKKQKLNIWENYVEGQQIKSVPAAVSKKKETLTVTVTEVLGGGKFYVQKEKDGNQIASIQRSLASLKIGDTPVVGSFDPKKGELVLAQFGADNSWNRAMIVNACESPKKKFEVFYMDYGTQEVVTYDQLRPLDSPASSKPGLAHLCTLAYIKVPSLSEDYGQEAAEYLRHLTLNSSNEFKAVIEGRDFGGKLKGQGTEPILKLTLWDPESKYSVNAAMLGEGLARLERRRRNEWADIKATLDALEEIQEDARQDRLNMWEYGDIPSDDEKEMPTTKAAGKDKKLTMKKTSNT